MKRNFPHVLAAFYGVAWAILPDKFRELEAVLWRRIGGRLPAEPVAFEDDMPAPPRQDRKPYTMMGSAAVIPIHGTITPRPSVFADWSGGTSAEQIGRGVDAAAADPNVTALVLDIDSPGGSVFGLPETAGKIRAARKLKPVHAVANHMAASAAYWLGSQATDLAVTPGGQVGSVGVLWAHTDYSKAEEMAGQKTTYIHAGENKVEGAPEFPLSEGAAAEMQRVVNEYYAMFVADVARGRGVSAVKVEKDFGQGRMRLATEATEYRMADRTATLEQVVSDVNSKRANPYRKRVAADLAALGLPTA